MAPRFWFVCFVCFAFAKAPASAGPPMWKAGVAKVLITPQQPMWLSGYAARTRPAEGKLQDLYAKALALEDAQGKVSLLVTLDLVGISREISHSIRTEITRRWRIPRENILLAVSHTHSGPAIEGNLTAMYALARIIHLL